MPALPSLPAPPARGGGRQQHERRFQHLQLLDRLQQDVRDGGEQPGAGDSGGGQASPLPHTSPGNLDVS